MDGLSRQLKLCLYAFLIFKSALGLAQTAPLFQMAVPEREIQDRYGPFFFNKEKPALEKKGKEILNELQKPLLREQLIDEALFELLEDELPMIEEQIKKYSSYSKDWENLLERLRFMRLQGSLGLTISPLSSTEPSEIRLKPIKSDIKGQLVAADLSIKGSPQIRVTNLKSFQLIEIDPKTGELRRTSVPPALLKALKNLPTFDLGENTFQVSLSIHNNIRDEESPDFFRIELEGWESSFKNIRIPKDQVNASVKKLFTGENAWALAELLKNSKAGEEVTELLKKEILSKLNKRQVDMKIWVERTHEGKISAHLSSMKKPNNWERVEKARSEGRLILEADSAISLKAKDLNFRLIPGQKNLRIHFQPEEIFSSVFQVRSFQPPQTWMNDVENEFLKQILSLIYGKNLVGSKAISLVPSIEIGEGGAELNLPIDWTEKGPQFDLEKIDVNLDFLDETRICSVDLFLENQNSLHFDLSQDLKPQIYRQLKVFLNFHEEILGPKFFTEVESLLLAKIQSEALSKKVDLKESGESAQLQITQFDLVKEGSIQCEYEKAFGTEKLSDLLDQDLIKLMLNSENILELKCHMQLPRELGLKLTNLSDEKADISWASFSLKAQESPNLQFKLRLALTPEGKMIAAPLTMNWEDVFASYSIPVTGEGSVRLGEIYPKAQLGKSKANALQLARAAKAEGAALYLIRRKEEKMTREEILKRINAKKLELPQILTRLLLIHLDENIELANARITQKLKDLSSVVPLGERLESFKVRPGENLTTFVENEVKKSVVETLTEDPAGIEEIYGIASNQKLENWTSKSRDAFSNWLEIGIGKKDKDLENAIVEYIKFPSKVKLNNPDGTRVEEWKASPLEELQANLNTNLRQLLQNRRSIENEALRLPVLCNSQIAVDNVENVGDVYLILGRAESLLPAGSDPKAKVFSRDLNGPNLSEVFNKEEKVRPIIVSLYTRELENIANDPENLKRVSEAIRQQALEMTGINDEFQIELSQVTLRLNEAGVPLARVKVKVYQPTRGLQKFTSLLLGWLPDAVLSLLSGEKVVAFKTIAGLPGWIGDRLTSPVTDVDGNMTVEVPIEIVAEDFFSHADGRHMGHFFQIGAKPEGFRVLQSNGWNSLFGGKAEDEVEKNASSFLRSFDINKALSIERYENELTFGIGQSRGKPRFMPLSSYSKLELDTSLPGENLYFGTINFQLVPLFAQENQQYEEIVVELP